MKMKNIYLNKSNSIKANVSNYDISTIKALWALNEAGRISIENGNCNMSLEEINEEIDKTRKEMEE